ncbi:MAG: ribosomal protein S18-alanine N-acetyltransferase [Neptuniibacter sp.]
MIRPLSQDDLPELLKLEAACFSSCWSEAQLSRSINHARYCSFGIYKHRLIGFALFSTLLDEAELQQIAIDPAVQREGQAFKLLTAAIEALQQQGIARIVLELRASNLAALALYRKLGFTQDSIRKAYYPAEANQGGREDAILMSYSSGE